MTAGAGSRVDAALAQTQQLRDRDTRETRKATARIAAETAKERTTLRRHLTELAPQLRAYDSFPNGEIQQLSIKFSGRDADFPSHLTTTRSALDTLGNSLAAASRSIAKREHDIEKKQRALVQKARAQILGT